MNWNRPDGIVDAVVFQQLFHSNGDHSSHEPNEHRSLRRNAMTVRSDGHQPSEASVDKLGDIEAVLDSEAKHSG